MLKIAVITASDRAYNGEYPDRSGPKIKEIIEKSGLEAIINLTVVPDEKGILKKEIEWNLDKDYILTTGGTGISKRDITPEVTKSILDIELPGIAEMLRTESYKETKFSVFSRGMAGIRKKTIIINFPGSVKAVTLCTKLILPLLEHGISMMNGGKH
ncbi:MAG: MogA/MoaB family molybdenum cofactor biosynthesis protein [Acidobacteriota bacterium]